MVEWNIQGRVGRLPPGPGHPDQSTSDVEAAVLAQHAAYSTLAATRATTPRPNSGRAPRRDGELPQIPAELSQQSGDEDNLAGDVTGLEFGERRSNVVEPVGALDWDDEVARRDRPGQFGQGRRTRRGRTAVALDAVLLDRGEVDDRVDPVGGDAELERQLDVAAPDEVDERGHRRLLRGCDDPLTDAVAIGDGHRAALAQPCVMALAGQCDDARARADRELAREHANAAARPGDHDRLTRR